MNLCKPSIPAYSQYRGLDSYVMMNIYGTKRGIFDDLQRFYEYYFSQPQATWTYVGSVFACRGQR
jgi:hypothetical protein